MSQQVAISNPIGHQPAILPKSARDTIAVFTNRLTANNSRPLLRGEAPSDCQRSWMTARKNELDTALQQPGSPKDIRGEFTKNAMALVPRGGAEDDIRGQQLIAVEVLADIPLFALRKACADFRNGLVGDGKWAPTPAQIHRHASRIAQPFWAERTALEAILKPASEPKQALISARPGAAERMRGILKGIAKGASAFPPPKEVRDLRSEPARELDADDRLRERRYADRPLTVSTELRESKPFAHQDVTS